MPGRSFAREPLEPTQQHFPATTEGTPSYPRKTLSVYSGTSAVSSAAAPGPQQPVFAVDLVVQRVEAIGRICLRFRVQRSLPGFIASGSPSKKRISSLAYLYAHKLRDEPVAL